MEFALDVPMNQSEKISIYVLTGILLLFYSGVNPPCLNSTPQHQAKTIRKASPQSGKVQNGDAWPEIFLRLHAQGLQQPLHIAHAGDGSGRLFVVEQPGRIQIIENGQVLDTPFLDIESRVKSGGEQGLLSVAFPPDYSSKDYFYVNYTSNPDGTTVISRFYLSDTNQADAGSEDILLTINQPYANHNGGQMAFSPNDGYLYIGLGDGGSGGDPMKNAQNLSTLLGKILRIDTESGEFPYRIPDDNPFVDKEGAMPEIWALGLRNPWRFSFDLETGDLYIGDVGENLREEIDFQSAASPGGANYGWNILEGSLCYEPPSGCSPPVDYSPPVAEYSHKDGCSVTGGFVYRGDLYPTMEGIYFYGDFCFGSIWGLRQNGENWENILLLDSSSSISAFGEDEAGNLYLADIQGGTVHEIVTDRQKGGKIRR